MTLQVPHGGDPNQTFTERVGSIGQKAWDLPRKCGRCTKHRSSDRPKNGSVI